MSSSSPAPTLPLLDKNIWVTRSSNRADKLAQGIEEVGGHALLFPLFSILPAPPDPAFEGIIAALDAYDFVVFVSPNAVDHGLNAIFRQRAWPPTLTALAPGLATQKALEARGISRILSPSAHFDSEALLELPTLTADNIKGKRVLILRGNGGREFFAESLRKRGATVDCVTIYLRLPIDEIDIKHFLREQKIDALAVFSSACLHQIFTFLSAEMRHEETAVWLTDVPIFTPYRRIFELAKTQAWKNVFQTDARQCVSDESCLIESLCRYNWRHERT